MAWLLAALLVAPAAAGAQETAGNANQPPSLRELQQKVHEAFAAEDYGRALENLGRMAQRLPFDGKLMYETAAAHALNGDKEAAFNLLITIQRQGLNFSPSGDKRFDSLKDYQLFGHVAELLEKNGEPFDKAETALTLDTDIAWPQAIARNGDDGDFFIAGLDQGKILRVTPGGEVSTFHAPGDDGPVGISALAVDAERGVLWAAGTAVRQNDKGLSINMQAASLFRFDLAGGELQAHFPITDDKPLPHLFNEIAVGPAGDVYAADALSPLIYRHQRGGESLEPFVGAPGLSGFHGIAVTPDGNHLLVSDWFTGLYRVSVADRQAHRVAPGQFVNLGGIHSLAFRDGKLYAVQTGTRPDRVMRIQLSESLDKAVAMAPLSASEAEYDKPGLGVLAGDGYYFVADSHWSLNEGPGESDGTLTILKADPELGAGQEAKPRIPVKTGRSMKGYEKPDGFVDQPADDREPEQQQGGDGGPEG